MKDPLFIQDMLHRAKEAGEKVEEEFSDISLEQLNWKSSEESWSIGQCLEHLIISDCAYFSTFKKIGEGNFHMSFWENWSPFGGLFGRMLVNQLQEKPKQRLTAPRIFRPSVSHVDMGVFERFHKHLDSFRGHISDCRIADLDKLHISSPVSGFITYSLRRAIKMLVQHEHRHINQAIRVKHHAKFPVLHTASI